MQFLTAILAFAAVAAAAPAASPEPGAPYEAPSPCGPGGEMYWSVADDGGGGGWGCLSNGAGGCREYYWNTVPPYWSCWMGGKD
ncbi:hypothetical protein CH063_07636 [Colletotrichum higginsianum]|uniref:EC89 protein n=2 Tax=Colletotrichum higginsianum TaxID=80884 RepID=H1V6W1_COLHI|nr:EC89 protein [Colletotrichum higginsianum IMI 349063]OBR12756.1 EC89 protein [Colletotrichum higginsianum IMI 349063]TID00147.1 hypothetical protein CH35J_005161 [Colletotrichum higginsianum]CCF35963.1 hypothetical protein CH063_07636 [Colletotrichum higginsianum]